MSLSPVVRPPCQQRSRKTLTRILEATEELLADRLFAEVTVQDIVRRAGTSVGAFYTRFPNKEALLPLLYDRYDKTMPRRPEDMGEVPPARDLAERVQQIVAIKVLIFRTRLGILRAMTVHARANPGAIPDSVRARRRELHQRIGRYLLEFREEIRHPDPERAVGIGLFMVSAMCRELMLHGNAPQASSLGNVDDGELRRELSRMLHSYLVADAPDASTITSIEQGAGT